LFNEKNNGESLLELMEKDLVKSAHDISLGGLIVALSKMCIKGNKGIKLNKTNNLINEIEYLFAEDQGRYIVEVNPKNLKEVKKVLNDNSVYHEELGVIIEKDMIINTKTKVTIDELKSFNTNWLTNYMSS
jgi:phosphoribosylformylglycinamidine synthase